MKIKTTPLERLTKVSTFANRMGWDMQLCLDTLTSFAHKRYIRSHDLLKIKGKNDYLMSLFATILLFNEYRGWFDEESYCFYELLDTYKGIDPEAEFHLAHTTKLCSKGYTIITEFRPKCNISDRVASK